MAHRFAILLCLFLIVPSSPLLAQTTPKRVAFVIGNQAYLSGDANPRGLTRLANPVSDARAVAALLREHNFGEILEGYDVNYITFERLRRRFSRLAENADTAFIFYAGHGMEVVEKGDYYNVVAPIDAEIDCETRQHDNTIRLDEIIKASQGAANQIIVVDACRNNPFARCKARRGDLTRGAGFRSTDFKAPPGEAILLAYSTAQKSFAFDGLPGEHSPFASILLKTLRDNPRASFLPLINQLVIKVGIATEFAQIPSLTIEGGILDTCLSGKPCTDEIQDIEAQRRIARGLAFNSRQQLNAGDAVTAILLALEALSDRNGHLLRSHDPLALHGLSDALNTRTERLVISGHDGPIYKAAWHPDGKFLLTGAADNTARIWDANSGTEIRRLPHDGPVNRVSWKPDGRRILTSELGSTYLWNAHTGEKLAKLATDPIFEDNITWSSEGLRIVAYSKYGYIHAWDAYTGSSFPRIAIDQETPVDDTEPKSIGDMVFGKPGLPIRRGTLSSDGLRLATIGAGKVVRFWDTVTGAQLGRPIPHEGMVEIVWSPDGNCVLVIPFEGPARIFQIDTGAELARIDPTLPAQNPHGYSLFPSKFGRAIWSPNGSRLLTLSDRGPPVVWDAQTGKAVAHIMTAEVGLASAHWSPDSRNVAAITDHSVEVWDASTGRKIARLASHNHEITAIAWSADSSRLVTATEDNTVRVWDAAAGWKITAMPERSGRSAFAWSPDAKRLITISEQNNATIWETEDLTNVGSLNIDQSATIRGVTWSPDGRHIITINQGRAQVWDAYTTKQIATLTDQQQSISTAIWNRDGSRVLTTSELSNSQILIWDPLHAQVLTRIVATSGGFRLVSWSPDSSRIAAVAGNRTIFVWEPNTGKNADRIDVPGIGVLDHASWSPDGLHILTASLEDGVAHIIDVNAAKAKLALGDSIDRVADALWSPDGQYIVTIAFEGKTPVIWNPKTGAKLSSLIGHNNWVVHMGWSPDASRLLTIGDGKAIVWNPLDGTQVASLSNPAFAISNATWSPDSRRVAVTTGDMTVKLWHVPTSVNDIVGAAKSIVPRCLTKHQRELYSLPAQPPDWCFRLNKWPYEATADWWMRLLVERALVGPLRLGRFKDPTYFVLESTKWEPDDPTKTPHLKTVTVPKHFVTDLGTIPRPFWSLLRPDGNYAHAAVIHDYLYWDQSLSRAAADEIFLIALKNLGINRFKAYTLYRAVRSPFGLLAWTKNARLKSKGEKRVLKILPEDPRTTWAEWKTNANVFE